MGGSAGAGGVSTSSSLSSGRKVPACRRLVGPGESFQVPACSQGSPTHIPQPPPLPSHLPPGCWRQDVTRLLRRATLHLPLSWSLPNSVPHPETFLTPLLVPASGVSPSGRPAHPSYSSLNLLSLGRSPACLWLVCWGSLHPGALWTSSACMQGHAGKANVGTWCWSEG